MGNSKFWGRASGFLQLNSPLVSPTMPVTLANKSPLKRLIEEVGPVDKVGVEERAAKFATRSIKKASKVQGLKMAVSMIDLTTLEGRIRWGKWNHFAGRRSSRTP